MRKTAILALVLAAATAEAATRLTYRLNGKSTAIEWPDGSFPIAFHISRTTPEQLPNAESAVARAFAAWQNVPDTRVEFRDGGVIDAAAGRDGKNLVTATSELFANSGFLAYTTNWFEADGRIVESDIQVDVAVAKNNLDLESVVIHEVGHLLGLDHSAVLSATMFPYVGSPAGLDSDDRIAISTLYPRTDMGEVGSYIRGEVRDGNGGVFGAQVVAVDASGTPVATGLTNPAGQFELLVMPEGTYTLYAEPLDGPVESSNLQGVWRDGRSGFRTVFFNGEILQVHRGGKHDGLVLQLDGRPASLNPRWIGAFPPGSPDIRLAAMPSRVTPGETVSIAIGGDGFLPGVTTFEVLHPGFSRVSEFQYGANYLWATFKVAPDTPAASLVVRVTNGDETAALTGAIKVERPPRRRPIRG